MCILQVSIGYDGSSTLVVLQAAGIDDKITLRTIPKPVDLSEVTQPDESQDNPEEDDEKESSSEGET